MSTSNNTFDSVEQAVNANEELKNALLEVQREAESNGLPAEEYAEKINTILAANGVEATPEVILAMVEDAGVDLTDEELDEVSGGTWSKDCDKWKDCGDGNGRSCYPHC